MDNRALTRSILRYPVSAFHHLIFFLPSVTNLALNVILSIVGIATAVTAAFAAGVDWQQLLIAVVTAIALLPAFAGIIFLLTTVRYRVVIKEDPDSRQPELADSMKTDPEIQSICWRGEWLVYWPSAHDKIDCARNPVELSSDRFHLPLPLQSMKASLLLRAPGHRWDLVNEKKVRALTSITHRTFEDNEQIRLQRTDYFNDRLTNHLAGKRIRYGGLRILQMHEWITDASGKLLQLGQSPMSDQLGGSTLLLTSDRKIVYVRQGDGSSENDNNLAPAGSGSFDWADVRRAHYKSQDFQTLARAAIFRELQEEVGIRVPPEQCLQILIGFGRYLYRAGKPEIFSITCAPVTYTELTISAGELDYTSMIYGHEIADIKSADGIIAGFNDFLSMLEVTPDVSGTLYFNTRLAIESLKAGTAAGLAAYFSKL